MRDYRPVVSTPKSSVKDWRSPTEEEANQRERDAAFQRALAHAFINGDHLPKGTVVPLRLIG